MDNSRRIWFRIKSIPDKLHQGWLKILTIEVPNSETA